MNINTYFWYDGNIENDETSRLKSAQIKENEIVSEFKTWFENKLYISGYDTFLSNRHLSKQEH
jgi:hypothetical protein